MDGQHIVEVSGLSKSFSGVRALNEVELTVDQGEIVGLIGPNGSGKTTALNCISGFIKPDRGTIWFKGNDITGQSPASIANQGMMRTFQITKLARRMTLLENMLLGAQTAGDEAISSAIFRGGAFAERQPGLLAHARELLATVKLSHLENDYAQVLSGGQQRLLSIALVLIRDPDVILLDEPAAGVHPELVEQFVEMIGAIRKESGKSFLIIEHNMHFISNVCDKVVVLDAGMNLATGTPDMIHNDPKVLEVYLGKQQQSA